MSYVPAATFRMGDTHGDGASNERPPHPVTLAAFWLDRTEVTIGQFGRFVQASGHRAQGAWRQMAGETNAYPVVGVNWADAFAYCRWAGKRLPTGAEWEYAARGTDGRKYPWGDSWEPTRARFLGSRGSGTTAPVGSYPTGATPIGILDLAGNVWEWTSSLYKPHPYVATDGREEPNASGSRVLRGGSWNDDPRAMRSTFRGRHDPTVRGSDVGFRCAQTP